MKRLRRLTAVLLLATLVLGAVAGCSKMAASPVAPVPAGSQANGRAAQSDGLISTVGGIVDGLVKVVFNVLNIVGSVGGTLSNGRWQIDVPAGAIDGTATVGVGVISSTSPSCQLQILPVDKNHFSTPVRLTVSCPNLSDAVLSTYVIFWFNPATKQWVMVDGSTVDLSRRTVSAPLQHFSDYSVGPRGGKAGW